VRSRFDVEGQTLTAFLKWFERESGRHLEFSKRLATTAIVRNNPPSSTDKLTAEEALDVILTTCGLVHRFEV